MRELYADAPEVGRDRAEERACRPSSTNWQRRRASERRPHRRTPGQGVGAHCDHSVRARGGEAAPRLAAICWKATSRARTWSARSTTCASCFWTTTRSCSSRRPMTASGTPISTTSRRRSRTRWTSVLQLEGGREFAAHGIKDWLVKHQITADGWYVVNPNLSVGGDAQAGAGRQGRR